MKSKSTKAPPNPAPAAPDPLKPDIGLLIKLGSLIVHAEELLEQSEVRQFFAQLPLNAPSQFDRGAMEPLLADPQIVAWREALDKKGFLPVKRRE